MVGRRLALDHNLPRPILELIQRFIPEVVFEPIRDIAPWLADLEDHDLIYELGRRGFEVMATSNYKMLNYEQVLVAIHQTRMSVFAVEGVGDDAILASGALLRDVVPALKKLSKKGQVFRFRPVAPRAERSFDALAAVLNRRHSGETPEDALTRLAVPNWRAQKAPLDPR